MNPVLNILCLFLFSEATYRVKVTQLKFQDEDNPQTYVKGIKQIESDGARIFLVALNDPAVIIIDENGRFIRRIGQSGPGPEEWLAYSPRVISVKGPSMWVMLGDSRSLLYYENDAFVLRTRIDSYQLHGSLTATYGFAFDNRRFVVQAFPGYGYLANAYNYGGEVVKKVGRILPREPEFLAINPALNNTIWKTDGRDWYCLFAYRPILRKYDANFELAEEFLLQGPEIEAFEEIYFRNEKNPNFDYPLPHFTDMKIHEGHIYFLCGGALYQVTMSAKVLSRTVFYGFDMSEIMREGKINFRYFTILNSGKCVFASETLFYERDLLAADLPFLKK